MNNLEQEIEQKYLEIVQNANNKLWKNRDGHLIPMSKMSKAYIKNCIKWINNNDLSPLLQPYLKALEEELKFRE